MKSYYIKSGKFLNNYVLGFLILLIVGIFSIGCGETKVNKAPSNSDIVEVYDSISKIEVIKINDYPSASGIVTIDSIIYMVGDDAKDLLILGDKRLRINFPFNQKLNEKGRVKKKDKLDFEALHYIPEDSVIWGWASGSKYPNRYVHFQYDIPSKSIEFTSLKHAYRKLQKDAAIKPKKWNIEGALSFSDQLALINRETNTLLFYNLNDWKRYLHDTLSEVPRLKQEIELDSLMPSIHGVKATLSGGEYWDSLGGLLLSASVEDDEGIIDDGAILGSFLCYVPITKDSSNLTTPNFDVKHIKFLKIGSSKMHPNIKLEGIGINTQNEIFGVVDNDDGTSLLIKFSSSEIANFIDN